MRSNRSSKTMKVTKSRRTAVADVVADAAGAVDVVG